MGKSAIAMTSIDPHPFPHPNPHHRRDFTVTCHSHRIRTLVTSRPSVVRYWIDDMCNYHFHRLRHVRMVVGLGVQWTPPEYPGDLTLPSTLQLCIGHRCLIFQLLHADRVPLCLRTFLSDPNVNFVGVSNYSDHAMLQRSDHNLFVSNLVDLRNVASDRAGLSRKISMEGLAELILGMEGVKKDTGVGRSNWDEYWLSQEQIEYACADAFLSFMLGKALWVWSWVDDDDDDDVVDIDGYYRDYHYHDDDYSLD